MANSNAGLEIAIYKIDGVEVPVRIFYEGRRNVRISSGKDAVLLRIPRLCKGAERQKFKEWGFAWIEKQWKESPAFRAQHRRITFQDGSVIRLPDRNLTLRIRQSDRKMMRARRRGDEIHIEVPEKWDAKMESRAAEKVIHKVLASIYTPAYRNWVSTLHNGCFSKPIASVSLKNMVSKWGSCSHDGRFSFSTRLLFAPRQVQEYVIIHELCHLDVLNHSDKFWKLVASHDPAYREKERWLRDHGYTCDLAFAVVAADENGQTRMF